MVCYKVKEWIDKRNLGLYRSLEKHFGETLGHRLPVTNLSEQL